MPTKSCRDFGYSADDHWAKRPPGYSWPDVAGVAADSRDNLFVFNRGEHPVIVFDRAGNFLRSWGEGQFVLPHGIAVDSEERVYVADRENSRVQIFSRHGQVIGEWTDVARPCQVRVMANGDLIVAELGFRAAMWPGISAAPGATGGRL